MARDRGRARGNFAHPVLHKEWDAVGTARPPVPGPAGEAALVVFWLEGVFYCEFCITVLDKVLAEQHLEGIRLASEALELLAWWSFRENVANDPSQAVAFLDLFPRSDPVWDRPTVARFRSAMRAELLACQGREGLTAS